MTSTIFQFIDREYRGTGKKITKMTQSLANYYKKHENDAITGKLLQIVVIRTPHFDYIRFSGYIFDCSDTVVYFGFHCMKIMTTTGPLISLFVYDKTKRKQTEQNRQIVQHKGLEL